MTEAHPIVSQVKGSVDTFQKASEQQKQIVEKNENMLQSFHELSKSMSMISNSTSEIIEQMPSYMQHFKEANERLKEIWNDYEKRFEHVDESARALFENISGGLKLVSNQSAEHIKNLNQQSAQVTNHFAQAVDELKEIVDGLETVQKSNDLPKQKTRQVG